MVKGFLQLGFLQWAGTFGLMALSSATWGQAKIDDNWKMLDSYCVECHNTTDWAGKIAFDAMTPADAANDAEVWEKAVRKMRGALMPPPGKKQPDEATRAQFIHTMETFLDRTAVDRPHAGSVGLHRLNRTEYANAVEDILGLNIDPSALLPRDDKSDGFDNAADVLKVSPSFLEQYMGAARTVTVEAIGNPKARATSRVFQGPPEANQYVQLEGLPLGTRGGMVIDYDFPADGDYELTINGLIGAGYLWGVMDPNTLIVTIDGDRVFEQQLGGEADLEAVDVEQAQGVGAINDRFRNIRRHVKAGPHKVGITFLAKTAAVSNEILHGFVPVAGMGQHVNGDSDGPRIQNVELRGPINASGCERDSEPPQDLRLQAGECGGRAAVCGADSFDRGSQGVSTSRDERGSHGRHGLLQAGARGRRLRGRHPEGAHGHSGQPEVPVSRAFAAGGRAARPGVPHQRSGPRVAALVLPLEPGAGRHAHRSGVPRQVARAAGAR
ncbi:MAG: DUF1587 domain-containing protein [Gammaproteobacteria bacterium]